VTCFPDTFRFRHTWRPYQQRVLDEFERHLVDRHFHVAAAPGAGKTILGLEALRRLGQPALVLAPTTAIRDQWLQRLREAFLQTDADPDWASGDLLQPAILTVSTYQGLHAADRRLGSDGLLQTLKQAGLTTLVLDEAHHLRHQWWACLVKLKAGLDEPWTVALTATPPFDVPQAEWNRYIELCGPLDEEVSVAELVKAGNLCPHQDFVYFSAPTEVEREALDRFDQGVRALLNALMLERELIDRLSSHPLAIEPQQQTDLLTRDGDYALALALFLHEAAPERGRALMQALGLTDLRLPPFGLDWAELLFNGLLFGRDASVDKDDAVLVDLTRRLRQIGAVEQRQVYLRAPPHLQRLLEASHNKCQSVAAIIELEARADPVGLRALVLCDQIREDDFPRPGEPEPQFSHLGVVPVFEHLRRLRLPEVRLGVLTGSLVILPTAAVADLLQVGTGFGLDPSSVRSAPLWHACDLQRIEASASNAGALLASMTRLFERGDVNVLVGTAALLGEGWDAPALSTLVLASTIRAAMRTNQMRGRAIRIQPGLPDKVSNIWHLACLHPGGGGNVDAASAGVDIERLSTRFRSFSGVGFDAPVIETGIERLALDEFQLRRGDSEALNQRMCRLAIDRPGVALAWRALLDDRSARDQRMHIETRVPLRRVRSSARFRHFLMLERVAWLRWLEARWLQRRLRRIGEALLHALRRCELVRSATARVDLRLGRREIDCRLLGALTQEESLFAEALRELFERPLTPRYLLQQGKSVFAVPACLGQNRKQADALAEGFARWVGRSQLVFTRNDTGRQALLRAREAWIAGRFDQGCDTRLRWG